MTVKRDFEDAFAAMVDAMTAAPSPKPYGTRGRWTAASVRADALGRQDAKWRALPSTPVGAAAATQELEAAKSSVDGADYESTSSVGAAIDLVETAVDATEGVLG